jgi:ADP-heptose:LPS heptosyltransferase/glycosyltransferase involved in cell wall biosynthesis
MIELPTYYDRNFTRYFDPGISLHQICKNEAHEIADFAKQVHEMGIEEWNVVDTGSTDGSIELLTSFGAKVVRYSNFNPWPGVPLDSFGRARNEALQLCTRRWVMWADFDDRFAPGFRNALNESMDKGIDCFDFNIKYGTSVFPHLRLWRNGMGVSWLYDIHEVPKVDGLTRYFDTNSIVEHLVEDKDAKRLPRNLSMCRRQAEANPDDPRVWFYLGNAAREAAYWDKIHRFEAMRAYERYLSLRKPKEFPDEVHMACFFLGHLYSLEGNLDKAEELVWRGIHACETYGECWMLMRDIKRLRDDKEGYRRWRRVHKAISKPKRAALFITDQFYADSEVTFYRPGAMGDLLMASPALQEAKRLKARTVFMADKSCAPVLHNHPWVDELEILDDNDQPKQGMRIPMYPVDEGYPADRFIAKTNFYKGIQYDCPMHLCQHFCKSCGFDVPKRFQITNPLLSPEEEQSGIDLYNKFGRYITLQTETGWSRNKEWFDERWQSVVDYLVKDKGITVVQVGIKSKPLNGTINLIGQVPNVRQLLGIQKRAVAHVGLDSVLNHTANGYDLPAIILFGSTSSHSSGYDNAINICKTRQGTGEVTCGPCWREMEDVCETRECMRRISTKEVIESCEGMLGKI